MTSTRRDYATALLADGHKVVCLETFFRTGVVKLYAGDGGWVAEGTNGVCHWHKYLDQARNHAEGLAGFSTMQANWFPLPGAPTKTRKARFNSEDTARAILLGQADSETEREYSPSCVMAARWAHFDVDYLAEQEDGECVDCGATLAHGYLCLDGGEEVCASCFDKMVRQEARTIRAKRKSDRLA